ncbi:hypothetical protein POMI540_2474 [Schizosaccharomyces pombe]
MEDPTLSGLDGRYIVVDQNQLYLSPISKKSEKLIFRFNLNHRGYLEVKSGFRAFIENKYSPLVFHATSWTNGFSIDVQKTNPISSYTPFVMQYLNSPWFSACRVESGNWQVFVGRMNMNEHEHCYPMSLIMKREDTWLRYYHKNNRNPIDWKLVQDCAMWPDGYPGTGRESEKGSNLEAITR